MLNRPGSKRGVRARGFATLLIIALLRAHPVAGAADDARTGADQQFQFHLRNGDRLTGTVVAEDGLLVIITNSLIGRVFIPANQLQRREAIAPVAAAVVERPPSPTATNAPAPLTAEQRRRFEKLVQIYMADQISAAEFQRRRAAVLAPPQPRGPKHWSGEVLAGIDLGYGAKSRQNFSGRARLNFTNKRLRNALDYLFTYGHAEGELSANRMDATEKLDFDVDTDYYLYALAGTGYDEIRKVDYYIQAGPGVGEHLIRQTNFALNAEVGVSYQEQNFEMDPDSLLFYYRLAQDMKWTISPKFTIDQKLEYLPQWDEFGQFKIRGEANLRYWLLDNLSLNLTVIDLYDTRVATGISRNDLQIRSSVGVKF